MAVTAQGVMNELHIDSSDIEMATIDGLIAQSTAIVNGSIDYEDYPAIVNDLIYDRAVITLTTAMYYDRTLADGMSKGLLLMLDHLQANCLKGAKQNGTQQTNASSVQ